MMRMTGHVVTGTVMVSATLPSNPVGDARRQWPLASGPNHADPVTRRSRTQSGFTRTIETVLNPTVTEAKFTIALSTPCNHHSICTQTRRILNK